MKYLKWIVVISIFISGCNNLHHSQELSKEEIREHLRPYVNNPNPICGKALLPGGVSYLSLNKFGISIIEQGDELKFILPTDIFFLVNSNEIQESKLPALNLLTIIFKTIKNSPIVITGHTDTIGTKQHKKLLSKKLAESCKHHFWKNGIDQKRLITSGIGDRKLISSDTLKGNALNRRVEIQIHNTK